MFEKVKKIIANELSIAPEKVALKSRLTEDLGADSLDAVELIMSLEEEFGITIAEDAAQDLKTVEDIVSYVEKIKKETK